ncbi:hypothetical protein [Peribacillus kribbensis]|uniref:hypothetical protein n=1 Tax=Peribacillus kribbensis TaxID=356658 RepID=UPI00040B9E09|nr:hypothetical protein [Peribacillus kribbensis]
MKSHSKKIKKKAKTTLNQLKTNLKERIFQIADIPSASVQQLADFIQQHPDVKAAKKELLGIPYYFYRLETEGYQYYLEKNETKILQLDGYYQGDNIVSYRAYRDHYALHNPIKLPT